MLLGFVFHFKTKVPVVLVGVQFHAEGALHVKWMALSGGRGSDSAPWPVCSSLGASKKPEAA